MNNITFGARRGIPQGWMIRWGDRNDSLGIEVPTRRGDHKIGTRHNYMAGISLKVQKQEAHRADRREWRQVLTKFVNEGWEDLAELEVYYPKLRSPRLTDYDVI